MNAKQARSRAAVLIDALDRNLTVETRLRSFAKDPPGTPMTCEINAGRMQGIAGFRFVGIHVWAQGRTWDEAFSNFEDKLLMHYGRKHLVALARAAANGQETGPALAAICELVGWPIPEPPTPAVQAPKEDATP